MKIKVDEILDEGYTITADSNADAWAKRVFETALEGKIAADDHLQVTLTAHAIGDQVECIGGYYYTIHPSCDRCGQVFSLQAQEPVHHHYVPAEEPDERRRKLEEVQVAEDQDFSFYEGRVIDVDTMLCEQIMLAQPVTYICREDCKGLCPQCGAALNEGPCTCKPLEKPHPFDALKGVKVTKK